MESKELENMESKISKLENELKNINDLLLKKNVQNDSEKLQKHCKEASILECKIDELYLRWDDLEKRKI